MSKWFERSVSPLWVILVSAIVVGVPAVQAQDNGEPQGEEAGEPAVDRKRAMISTGLDSEAIAENRPDAAIWLEPPEEDRVRALFEPEADTPARGALMILADEGQSAESGLAGALREPMARAGWAVMTLGLEPPPYAVQQARRQELPARPVAPLASSGGDAGEGENDNDTDSVMIDVMDSVDVDELTDQYRDRISKALSAAVANLQERDYDRVAIAGVGRAAGHVARMATAGGDVSEMIWIAPVFARADSGNLAEWLSEAGGKRVLELHSSRLAEQQSAGFRSPRQREVEFRRADITTYTRQPVAMAERPGPRDARALANRLSAWLASDR